MQQAIARLKEPSTWAAIAAAMAALGVQMDEQVQSTMVDLFTGLAALGAIAGVVLKERGDKDDVGRKPDPE